MPTYLKGCLKEPDPPSQTPYFYILSLKYIELGSLDFSTVVFHPVLQLFRCYYQIDSNEREGLKLKEKSLSRPSDIGLDRAATELFNTKEFGHSARWLHLFNSYPV